MPTQLSKFSIDATCKQYAHPWTDSCISSTAGLGLDALQDCLRIYSTFYVLTLLMKGKIPSKKDILRTILGILQSTAFLSWSAFSYSMFICSIRRLLGNFNIVTISFLPSFLSSLSAILIERPSRRTLLCLYVSNIATETLFRMLVWRGYCSIIPRGETYIFAISMATLLYFYRSKKDKNDSIYKVIRFIIGPYEETGYLEKNKNAKNIDVNKVFVEKGEKIFTNKNYKSQMEHRKKFNIVWKTFETYKKIIQFIKMQSKHTFCPHPYSCAHYVLTGSTRAFGYGLCGQIAFKLVIQLSKLLKKPKLLKSTIFKKSNLNLAVFLGGFTGIYRLISCSLRRFFNKDSHNYAILAGLIASSAFMAYPDNTVALYVMWKALQLLWNTGVEHKYVPEVKWFVIFLYCFSTAVLFHAAIVEPQNLRPSYWKFLYNLSGGRIATMRRDRVDEFGLETYKHLQEVLKATRTTDQITYSF